MDELTWGSALDVGVDAMNKEHRELIGLMRELEDQSRQGADKAHLLKGFDAVINYVSIHFSDEEAMMEAVDFPDLKSHKEIHQGLLAKLHKYHADFENSGENKIPSAVFDFFRVWLTTHIMIVDKKYGAFIKGE